MECPNDCDASVCRLELRLGQTNMFKTQKETLPDLMQPGSLANIHELLPKTFQDAITLTRQQDYRYLWIDALCIVQDNDSDKSAQIQIMDTIFTRASFTIAAASGGDANAGLRGVMEGSRNIVQHIAPYSNELTLLSHS
jgi:hypothetical protein